MSVSGAVALNPSVLGNIGLDLNIDKLLSNMKTDLNCLQKSYKLYKIH